MEYSYFTNNEKIYEFLRANTKREVIFKPATLVSDVWADLSDGENERLYVMIMYESKSQANENKAYLAREKAQVRYYTSAMDLYDSVTGQYTEIASLDEYLEVLKTQLPVIEINLKDVDASSFKIGYHLQCGNCGYIMDYESKYCRMCGAPRGEGLFDILPEEGIDFLYGSPYIYKVKCPDCGKAWLWETFNNEEETTYCVECGAKGVILKRKLTDLLEWLNFESVEEVDAWLDREDENEE